MTDVKRIEATEGDDASAHGVRLNHSLHTLAANGFLSAPRSAWLKNALQAGPCLHCSFLFSSCALPLQKRLKALGER